MFPSKRCTSTWVAFAKLLVKLASTPPGMAVPVPVPPPVAPVTGVKPNRLPHSTIAADISAPSMAQSPLQAEVVVRDQPLDEPTGVGRREVDLLVVHDRAIGGPNVGMRDVREARSCASVTVHAVQLRQRIDRLREGSLRVHDSGRRRSGGEDRIRVSCDRVSGGGISAGRSSSDGTRGARCRGRCSGRTPSTATPAGGEDEEKRNKQSA